MASLAKLLFLFLVFCSAAWVLLVITGASIMFQVAGCNCLRDFTLKLTKGPLESISIGEIKLSLVKMGFSFISGKPKLYLLISDFEIALRPSEKGSNKKSNPKRSRSTSKGKLMILINMARFLSVTVRELVVKVPKAAIEIKELTFDVYKGSNSGLKVKLHLVPIYVQIYDPRLDMDPPSNFSEGDCLFTGQLRPDVTETNYAPFICEGFWVTCEFGHDIDQGMKIRTLDLACGDLTLNLNEKMFIKTKTKSESFTDADAQGKATFDPTEANDSQKDKVSNQSVKKHIFMFPEKVSFNLPKLNVKFMHGGLDLVIENSVVGVYLNCKSQAYEDSGELTSHLDIRTGFREIHLVKEGATSVLEVLKVAIVASIDVPMQPSLPIRIEIDLKLGRTQCNLIISRLKPWLFLHMSKKKSMGLRDEKPKQERSQTSKMKAVMWTCTVSAPEMIIVLYSLNDLPLYRGGSQSSHLLANNIASKGIQVHAELGELDLQMADKNQQYLSEKVFGAEINSGSLVHVPRVSLDWGHREVESHEEQDPNRWKLVLSIDITGLGVFICFQHVESLILNMMSFKALLKGISGSGKKATQNKVGQSSKTSSKGTQICKLNLDKCSINYCGDLSVEDMIVADPKRVNFGSQGGQVLISVSADGTPRTASITSSISSDCKKLKISVSLDIVHLNLCLNKAKHSTKVELERARSIYQEYSEDCRPSDKMTLLDMQKAKFVRRTGGLHEAAVCSLFNATDIAVGWEPDLHLALVECIIQLKALLSKKKNEETDAEIKEGPLNMKDKIPEKEATVDQVQSEKQNKKRESIFAVDVEMLRVSAELADGVQAMVHVHSIFSENAKIGVLLEGLVLTFDEARVFRSSRMQISRIPISNAKAQSVTTRDWVIQGADVHICMPYRLQLRAIDDAVEDTLRALKLIASAKTNLIFPAKKDTQKKVKAKSTKFGSVRFMIRKLTVDIEEEPLQGWLDEHYKLMKNKACELEVRMKFLDNVLSEGSRTAADAEPNDLCSEQKIRHNGVEIDAHDLSAVKGFYEEIHRQSFHSYYLACKKLIPSEGSGAYKSGFQSGFKHSTCRDSVLLLCATELDVTLTKVEGGETGMIQFINRIDPISLDNEIPFSRLYGGDFVLNTGSLVAQIRDYTYPLFAGTSGTCKGRIVLAQQATPFQPQIHQYVSVGRWWTVRMLRSASGTTPPMKFYSELPVFFQKGEVSFGVGYEPVFADISYAFTVALRRAYLGSRSSIAAINDQNQAPKKERSLPWWDDMRNYVHGKIGLSFKETKWNLLGTADPYEKLDVLQLTSGYMDIRQTDGNVCLFTKDFKAFLSSLESLMKNCTLKPPCHVSRPFLDCPAFSLDVSMDWECESGTPLNHYIFALPKEGIPREKVFDPFRSTALSLRWCFNLGSSLLPGERHAPFVTMGENATLEGSPRTCSQKLENTSIDSPTINLAEHDLAWLAKFWNLMYLPPHKLRLFSRFPRFGVPRIVRSGNLSLDRVMTEFFLRFDCTPTCIKHTPLSNDDPSSGLTFRVTKLKLEICFSRGKQLFTFDCKRDPLDLVYQGLDLHLLKVYLSKDSTEAVVPDKQMINRNAQNMTVNEKSNVISVSQEKCKDDGFLLHSDYFTIRRQTPKADATRLLSWQEAGRNNNEVSFVKSEYEDGSESEQARSDPSDDDGFNVVVADNCQRIFVYGLKILWNIENRDAVMSFAAGLSKAFKPSKPSPSRQYAQRKLFEEQQALERSELPDSDALKSSPSTSDSASFSSPQVETSGSLSPLSAKTDCPSSVATVRHGQTGDSEEEGTRNFMVNVIQPQFNLHSEEANGRFLLAAASGRVLARSFHSVLHVGYDMIEKALGTTNVSVAEIKPEMTWKRVELSVMLEHVQAHVAPTDVDPGAGVQWLPKILRGSPKVKRTGALLERVFMPCQMYFRYTRHKGGTPELKVKPLKELTFNSPNITAAMTSRQFQVMMDVLTNLLFARTPKPHTSSLPCASDDDEEEEADEVVPDGIEEVELAKIDLEQEDRKRKLLLDDIRTISIGNDTSDESSISPENNADLWMISCGKSSLVLRLKKELANTKNSRKEASFSLRIALQKAAQLRLIEKEKNKSPSYAMRISVKINKVGWSMLADGKSFAEAEINEMIYDFDRDFKDIGGALFTIRSLVVKNCLPNAKSDILLSAWNAPSEWGKKVMLRVNAKQGAPKDGSSPIELFQVEIYPLKIHLTETMYRMMWGYLFLGEEQDTQRRQEAWKVSTTSSSRRQKKGALVPEASSSPNYQAKKTEAPGKLSATTVVSVTAGTSPHGDSSQASKSQNAKSNNVWSSTPELRRTSSFDRTWEESLAESVADELVLQANSPRVSSSKSGHQNAVNEGTSKNKPKDSKSLKSSRSAQEEKVGKPQDEKRSRPRKMMEFHNIKISQVELLLTYEGSRLGFPISDLRLLMDTFHRDEFTGTWTRLFSRVKKHIIWGVLKSVTGMQGKKFKAKSQKEKEAHGVQREGHGVVSPKNDILLSDSDGDQPEKSDQLPVAWPKRPNDGAGDGFVTSIRGLFNNQRRKAKAFVLRTMRGEADNEFHGEWSESDVEFTPFARQLTITKAKKLIQRHKSKYRSRTQKSSGVASQQQDSNLSSPREMSPFQSDDSSSSSSEESNE